MEKTKSPITEAVPETVKAEPIAQPAAAPATAAPATPATNVVYVEKKGGGGAGKCILIGCILLLLCCCITLVGACLAPQLLVSTVMGQNKGKDISLTRMTSAAEVQQLVDAVKAKENSTTGMTMTYTEQELLAVLVTTMKIEQTPDKVGLKITPGDLKFDVDAGVLFRMIMEASNTGSAQAGFNTTALDGLFISVELGTTPDGKNLTLKSFSTGNTFIDSLIPASVKTQMEESVQNLLAESFGPSSGSEVTLEKIEFTQGSISITFKPVTP